MTDKKISDLISATTPLAGTEVVPLVQSSTTKKATVENILTSVQPSGTANGIVYLNGSKVATSGSALSFNGTNLSTTGNILASGTGNKALSATSDGGVAYLALGSVGVGTQYFYANVGGAQNFMAEVGGQERFKIDTNNITITTTNLKISTADKGIDFSANTNAAGMTSELLNDYEEGTFTPVVADADTGGNTATGTFIGNYTKIGRIVHATLQLANIDTTGMTAANNLVIRGLPFTAVTFNQYPCPISWANLSTGGNIISGSVLGTTASLYLVTSLNGANNGYIKVSAVTSGSCNISINVTYQT